MSKFRNTKLAVRINLICLLAILLCITGCHIKNTKGNLIGVVTRENSGKIVKYPLVLISDPDGENINPFVSVRGDNLGRFQVTLDRGAYAVSIGTSWDKPFAKFDKDIKIRQNQTTILSFLLPEDF